MVDFQDFPSILVSMLSDCIQTPETNLIVMYISSTDGTARLDLVQNMKYKFVELLSVDFIRSPSDVVRRHVCHRYHSLRKRAALLSAHLDEVNHIVQLKNPQLSAMLRKGGGSGPRGRKQKKR